MSQLAKKEDCYYSIDIKTHTYTVDSRQNKIDSSTTT